MLSSSSSCEALKKKKKKKHASLRVPRCRDEADGSGLLRYLYLVVGLDELLKAHLLLQIEAEFFQAAEDAVVVRGPSVLLLPAAVCGAAPVITLVRRSRRKGRYI